MIDSPTPVTGSHSPRRVNPLAIGVVFHLSGIAGLIYEVVWFRMLANTFGATGPAIAVTSAAFMAGLGLGSQLSGKYADRSRRPAIDYAILEFLIAVAAVLMPVAISGVQSIAASLSPHGAYQVQQVLEYIGVFLLLVIPTMLMGATLTVLTRAVVESESHLGRRFAWLYGMNTLGAVLGALLAGFFLIPAFGISATVFVAVGLNVVAGLLALGTARRTAGNIGNETPVASPATLTQLAPPTGPQPVSLVEWVIFMTGFVAMACQYHWTRSLIFAFDRLKNTTYSFSSVLGVTLFALVVGAMIAYAIADRIRNLSRLLAVVLGLAGASIILSVVLLFTLPPIHDSVDPGSLRVDFLGAIYNVVTRSLIVIGLPTVLMGVILPVAVRMVAREQTVATSVGRLYAFNTWGAVTGSIASAYLLTPTFGLAKGLVFLGCVAVGLAILFVVAGTYRRKLAVALCVVSLISIAWQAIRPNHWSLSSLLPGERVVRYVDGPMATVSVIENDRGERRISVDDVPVAGTSKIMQTDQKSLAHWGMMLAGQPRRALTVGFGSGGASYSFLLHDRLERLDCVEISRNVPRFADLLKDANHGLLDPPIDPRYHLIFADARAYLQRTTAQYDVIVSDCTDLRYRSSANLYDLEYFQLCKDHLTDNGCTVIWMPLGGLSPEAFRLTLRTFFHVYPKGGVFYLHNRWTHYVLLVGHRQRPSLSVTAIRSMLAEEDVYQDLSEIGMTDPYKILATFLTSAEQLQPLLAGNELNTENHPRLEFAVPRFDTGPWSAQKNLNSLRSRHCSVRPWLADDIKPADLIQIDRAQKAAALILAAQEAERQTDVERATRLYLQAQQHTPADAALQAALRFPELRRIADTGHPTAWLLLGRSLQIQGEHSQAVECFDRYRTHRERLAAATSEEQKQLFEQARAWSDMERQWRSEVLDQAQE